MGRKWQFFIGTCLFIWLESPGVNWDRSSLYFYEVPIKFNIFCRQEWCLNLMLILVIFWDFGWKTMGRGWSNSQGENHEAGPLCLLELLGSTFYLTKFHRKGRDDMYVSPLPGPLINSVLKYIRTSGLLVSTTFRKRPPLFSDQLSKIPQVSPSNHYIWNLL